jgi:outer membrane protein
MNTGKFFLVCVLLLFLINSCIYCQDTFANNLNNKWTLQQCIEYAKVHNIQINTSRLNQHLTEQDLLLAKAAKLPNLSANLGQNLNHGNNFNTLSGSLQNTTALAGNYSVNSSLVLYNGNYIHNDIKQKRILLEAGNLYISQIENDVTLQVTQAFLNILIVKESIFYLEDLLRTSAEQLTRQQQLYDAGSIARKDLVQMQAQLAADKYNLVSAQNNYKTNILTLKQLLLLPAGLAFETAFPDSVNVEKMYPALSNVLLTALQNRPEVKAGELNVQASKIDIEKARAGLRPSIIANGGLSSGYSNQSGKYFAQLDKNFFQQAGLTLSIPIFNRRVTKTAIEKGKIVTEQVQLDLVNTKTIRYRRLDRMNS